MTAEPVPAPPRRSGVGLSRARRPGPTVRVRVAELRGGEVLRHDDRLITEEPLEIRLAWPGVPAERVWVTMRTPGHDFELAAGWLAHEGVSERPASVAYCTDRDLAPEQELNVVTVTLDAEPARRPGHRHDSAATGSSACGVCGADSIADVLTVRAACRPEPVDLDPDVVRALPDALRLSQTLFDRTGGVHAAGLFTAAGETLVVREDVGRHNAVDKVTGARVLAGHAPGGDVLVVSGRAGFELVQKAVTAGIGALVAVGAPTSLSARLAGESGLALYGFVRGERAVRYA
ncbi:formate dehydrogenase accessory sulfurtransferase FdhD [Nocardioides sp. TRM66260-LWL]|uniref:formate dehydrogenase accessory sulfurtransferase FdhD n=1 Tax=Nocardioides sp. TRM66260-LWL TaxID=2874478 RepID=UPI001CC54A82|nr:formate dehydrogenase accessory sulfurtransferase FdhD [Nocardioides sp. TRM66260-LWL]MBZ5734030.1 formate dehydrogenase accessory sulfurtransferase FdhD [Nocardioides sp. TRM66260-LWL]